MSGMTRAPSQENVSTTLSAGVTDIATTMSVSSTTGLVYPMYLVIDRVDSAGTLKNTGLWEYVKVTNITGTDLTIERGGGGSTAQAHSSGAVVEAVATAQIFTDYYNAINPEHTATGGHVLSTLSIAEAIITTGLMGNVSATSLNLSGYLNAAGASITGFPLNPTWYIPSLPSLPSTSLGRPMAMPRSGTWKFATVTLSANISQPTVFFDINNNFTSIFDAIGRPMIAGGTFVSTASIKTPAFKAGEVFNVDYEVIDLGGNNVDATVTLSSN